MGDSKQQKKYHYGQRLSLLWVRRLEGFVIDSAVARAILSTSSVPRRPSEWLGCAMTSHGANDVSVPERAFAMRGPAPACVRARRPCRADRAVPGYRI